MPCSRIQCSVCSEARTLNPIGDSNPCGMLGQVWYFIVSIPDLCHLSYFVSASREDSYVQTHPSLSCLQTRCMEEDEGSDQSLDI